eukprot:186020-Pelagomonas_calceolata.AAC.1
MNTINRAELAGIFVALQQGHTEIVSDSASCLFQISKEELNLMQMRTTHRGHAIPSLKEHYLHPIHSYKVKAHSGIIGNEGADACARTAALMDTMDIAHADARGPFHNFHWISLKPTHGHNSDPHHFPFAPTHYLINLTDKF